MELKEFIKKINLQQEIIDKIIPLVEDNKTNYEKHVDNLLNKDLAESTYQSIFKEYNEDIESLHILAIYLLTCLKTYDNYVLKGIDESIFIDTMKCFSRFIDECKVKTNKVYFDRAWWVYRQTSMKEFRIGELEYELNYDEKNISIHVPSDAILTTDKVKESLLKAKCFFKKYYNEFDECEYVISSWLLSPKLKKYLNENSNILRFQDFFEVISIDDKDTSIFEWVFKVNKVNDYKTLKEDTALQRKIKKDLIDGNNPGAAFARLKNNI